MSNGLISFFLAAGAAAWIFNKLQQNSGYGNTTQSVTAASIAGLLIFGLFLWVLKWLGG